MKNLLAILLFVLLDALGDVFVTKGMKQVGEVSTLQPRQLLNLVRRALSNPFLGLGVLSLTGSFALYLALLSWADLSFVLPMTAPSYVLASLGAKYFLQEKINTLRWIGTIFICMGVALISAS